MAPVVEPEHRGDGRRQTAADPDRSSIILPAAGLLQAARIGILAQDKGSRQIQFLCHRCTDTSASSHWQDWVGLSQE